MACRRKAAWSLLLMLTVSSADAAAQHCTDAQAEASPPLELLEFLGQWETDDGEWMDPQALEDPELVNLLEAVMATDKLSVESNNDSAGEDASGASQSDGGSDDSN